MNRRSWTCDCGALVYARRGDTECPQCDQPYNAFGQRLRRDWADNPSSWDENISDLDGYEMQHADY